MLSWAYRFNICCFLDNHGYGMSGHAVECLLGAGARESLEATARDGGAGASEDHAGANKAALTRLADFVAGRIAGRDPGPAAGQTPKRKDWLFGHFGYGLAKETEPLRASADLMGASPMGPLPDKIGFPDLFFFVPEIVIELMPGSIRIGLFGDQEAIFGDQQTIWEQIRATTIPDTDREPNTEKGESGKEIALQPRFSREEYLATVKALQEHIHRGDCYEINFCQEFFSCPVSIDPLGIWFSLSRNSPNPFAAFYKLGEKYLLCASPERYLKRTGDTLLSQPIKGTSPRGSAGQGDPGRISGRAAGGEGDPGDADQAGRDRLFASSKDRSENVMVVDLVRNDLSKVCLEGSVVVEELYGIYSFPQVHQMISSIRGELPPGTGLADCVRATFPMGSMTGAPKNRVVELIAQTERTQRGIFSGAVGYMRPDGDFDFNVVIRSILYNNANNYLSYQVGSGITFYSDPGQEYEECLWKAEGIKKALGVRG